MNPDLLRPHAVLMLLSRVIGELGENRTLLADIETEGILEPVPVIAGTCIYIDGRRRVAAARKLQVEVPVVEIPKEQEVATVLCSLYQRRYLTKGQLAYVSYPLLQLALKGAQALCMPIFKEDGGMVCFGALIQDARLSAARLGICRDRMRLAHEIHEAIKNDEDLRVYVEVRLFVHGHGLAAIKAGLEVRKAYGMGMPGLERGVSRFMPVLRDEATNTTKCLERDII